MMISQHEYDNLKKRHAEETTDMLMRHDKELFELRAKVSELNTKFLQQHARAEGALRELSLVKKNNKAKEEEIQGLYNLLTDEVEQHMKVRSDMRKAQLPY
jgi:hypothetical protein